MTLYEIANSGVDVIELEQDVLLKMILLYN